MHAAPASRPARWLPLLLLLPAGGSLVAQHEPAHPTVVEASARAAARATVADASPNAFGFPLPALDAKQRRAFMVGNSFFKQNWVTTPASTNDRDGLGPLFNARSCSACHRRDGRSAPPADDDPDRSGLLLRSGIRTTSGADAPHPVYGGQIQDAAIHGVEPEAKVTIRYRPVAGQYGDGEPFTLQSPDYAVEGRHGPLGDEVVLGPRTAPQLIGLGLLEAIPRAQLEAWADPDDRDGNGISGRLAVLDAPAAQTIGRFGWKATQPTVESQTAAAFVNDLGITSALFPHETLTAAQQDLVAYVPSEGVEIDAATLDRVVFYTRALAVPAARGRGRPDVETGRQLFARWGCADCHVPAVALGTEVFVPALAGLVIEPFTDLLLHDLGSGLADGKRDGAAGPGEWRTPPLWGIGLVPTVNGHSRYLHDGRARDLAEAVLWHGGEALAARERFRLAGAGDRAALLAFLGSL